MRTSLLMKVLAIGVWGLVAAVICITLWMGFTQPEGAHTQPVDGHCYRYESRQFLGMHWAAVYWELPCP